MVKDDEITKEFNSLNKKTADKIEKFIRDKTQGQIEYDVTQKNLDQSLREFDKEMKVYTSKFQSTLKQYQNFFDDFEIEEARDPTLITGLAVDEFLAEPANFIST